MTLATVVWRNLTRRPLRSALTVCGLAVAVAAVVALVGVSQGFEREFLRLYVSRGVHFIVQRGGVQQFTAAMPEALGESIRALPEVDEVQAGLMDVIAFEDFGIYTVLLNGWGAEAPWFRELTLLEGRRLAEGDGNRVMLGRLLAAKLGASAGSTIKIYDQDFEVIGIFESSTYYENGGAVMLLHEMQKLRRRPGEVTAFLVKAKHPENQETMRTLREQIVGLNPKLKARVEFTEDYIAKVPQIKVTRAMAWLTSAIALVIGAIGMLNTMIMSVYERTREIGTLRAIGWRKGRVVRLIVGESLVLSLAAFLAGTLAAVLLVRGLSNLPATSGLIGSDIAPGVMVQGFFIAMSIGLFGAAYPAWWGASLLPTEALRKK